jgi:hypothetical protein
MHVWLWLTSISCLNCKHYVSPPNYRWTDLAKCKLHHTFAEKARKNESQCGFNATYFIQKVVD